MKKRVLCIVCMLCLVCSACGETAPTGSAISASETLQEVSREGKEILTLGVYEPLGLSTQDAILAFNRSSEDYYLELQPYASVDALNLAIASGEGPDPLNVSGFPVAAYARKNLFYV